MVPSVGRFGAALVWLALPVALAAQTASTAPFTASVGPGDLESVLARVGRYVEQYFSRAQSLVTEETVTIQPLRGTDMAADGFPRRLVYELRVEWQASSDGVPQHANVVRQLVRVGGRPAKPGSEPECLDPKSISPEPLAFLLPSARDTFRFSLVGRARLDRREAVVLEFAPSAPGPPVVTGTRDCLTIDVPARSGGRVWLDPETSAVLRLDEWIRGRTDVMVPRNLQRPWSGQRLSVDRAETTTRYRAVVFDNPDETILLPAQIDSVSVIYSSGVQRLRVTQTFARYRRFLTESRVIE